MLHSLFYYLLVLWAFTVQASFLGTAADLRETYTDQESSPRNRGSSLKPWIYIAGTGVAAAACAWATYGPSINTTSVTPLSQYALAALHYSGEHLYQIACSTSLPWILTQLEHVISSRQDPTLLQQTKQFHQESKTISLTGIWSMVSHPIDSAEAIADALMNYEETFDFIASRIETVINEYESYTPAQKGALFGKISSELFTSVLLPAGSVKNVSKLTEALNLGKTIWTTSARLKKYQLPTRGHIRFVPPKNYHPGTELPKGSNKGFIDRFGNEWCKGESRTLGEAFEWDVQLGKHATDGMRKYATKKNVVNVSLKGKVTH